MKKNIPHKKNNWQLIPYHLYFNSNRKIKTRNPQSKNQQQIMATVVSEVKTKNADTLVGIPTAVSGLKTKNADTLVGIPTAVSGLKTIN
ncbi:MAG: hypothetical protein IPP29_09015 [Bacteroidetes bacterium]|nr:hypothetical protein [Bacteroidota bacterium]